MSHRLRAPAALLAVFLLLLGSAASQGAARYPASGARGMVVTSQRDATLAGVEMLELGGNAIDAAVATAFALSVTTPFSSGLGGGAFILIRLADGRSIAVDCRETAPAAATSDMYLKPGVPERASLRGPLAVATPGLVAGLAQVQQKYGKLPLSRVVQPAIRIAHDGFEIGPYHANMINRMQPRIPTDRFPETARIQFPEGGAAATPEWRLVQRDLAETLQRIAALGPAGFYEGPVARAIAATMKEQGGLVTAEDLKGYAPRDRAALEGEYRGYSLYTFPPPSSGAILLQALNILEDTDLPERGFGSSGSLHLIAEALKLAFADRAAYLGDPDFVDVPTPRLISKAYADEKRELINPAWFKRVPWKWFSGEQALTFEGPGEQVEDSGTVHLSVSDAAGNAVAMTKTINTPYGSGITVPGTGVILNNEMDDFSKAIDDANVYGLVDTRGANAIAPGKRPLSSMSPTILTKDGQLFMVTGSPGGPRIVSATLLSILNVVDFGKNAQAAVTAPRIHHQWEPDVLLVEPDVPRDVVVGLEERGHEVKVSPYPWSAVEAIVIDPESGRLTGGSDPRRGGLAAGY